MTQYGADLKIHHTDIDKGLYVSGFCLVLTSNIKTSLLIISIYTALMDKCMCEKNVWGLFKWLEKRADRAVKSDNQIKLFLSLSPHRRIYPPDDKLLLEKYESLLSAAFQTFLAGRAASLQKEMNNPLKRMKACTWDTTEQSFALFPSFSPPITSCSLAFKIRNVDVYLLPNSCCCHLFFISAVEGDHQYGCCSFIGLGI